MKLAMKWLAAAAALALSASFAQAQIKIGAVLSVTGGASFLGDPEKKTLEMYVADINAKGGIGGKKIELVIYDDASNPNKARTFATRLIEQDKVDALLGGLDHGEHHGDHPARGRGGHSADQFRRRGAGGVAGEEVELQDAAYRSDGLREDLRGHEEAQPHQDRDDFRRRCVRQVDARPVHDREQEIRHRGPARGDLSAAPTTT